MNAATLATLRTARAEGRAVALCTWLDGRDQQVVTVAGAPLDPSVGEINAFGTGDADVPRRRADDRGGWEPNVSQPLSEAVATALRTDRATVVTVDGAEVLVEPHNPPLRLVLVGAVHIAAPLAAMATLAGFAVTIVDPRRAFATAERFPGHVLVVTWPDVAIPELVLDARTAVVTLTHDPKLDDPGLIAALASPAFYVGCLGSKKTHGARQERLAAAGVGADLLARLRGPVGLRIGARTPAEIAVSILAEIIAALRGGEAGAPPAEGA